MSGISPIGSGGSSTTVGGARSASSSTNDASNPLAALQGTMQQAAAHGSFTNAGDASAILATGDDFLKNGAKTVSSIDANLSRRQEQLAKLKSGGGSQEQIDHEQEQIQLWSTLRDRIQEAMDKVSKILTHQDSEDDDRNSLWLDPARQAQQGLQVTDTATHLGEQAGQAVQPAASTQQALRAYGT